MRGPRDGDDIKREFARRLQAAMIHKGWNQSELARRASEHLPKPEKGQKRAKAIGRDSVSHYLRAQMLPLPVYLDALAKALGMRAEELMPTAAFAVAPPAPGLHVRGLPDGRMSITIGTCTMSADAATKIMAIVAEESKKA